MNEEQKKFVEDTVAMQKKGFELLYKYGIAEKLEGNLSTTTKPFMDLWRNYCEQQGRTTIDALMYTVTAFTEGKASVIERSIICQTVSTIVEKHLPNHPLVKELKLRREIDPASPEECMIAARLAKDHFDLQ